MTWQGEPPLCRLNHAGGGLRAKRSSSCSKPSGTGWKSRPLRASPDWLAEKLAEKKKLKDTLNTLGKVREHLYGDVYRKARGGEGHLEVGKNVYYTVNHLCHMVLSLKPFGCMPSTQSDGAQSAVVNRFKEMIFLPIETSGEGEINAHSRARMALGKAKAKAEAEQALASTGKSLDQIKGFVADHPQLRKPFYPIPHRPGIACALSLTFRRAKQIPSCRPFRRKCRSSPASTG
jgi:hypothetical protein